MESNTYPVHIFPEEIQLVISHSEEVLNFDPNLSGVSWFSAIATCIGKTVKLDNRKYSKPVVSVFWFALVSGSGDKKTPTMNQPFEFLTELDGINYKRYKEETEEWERNGKKGKKPEAVRSVVRNFTLESFPRIHENNPKGFALHLDELSGTIKGLGAYKGGGKGGGDKESLMSLHTGGALSVDRKGEEPIVIPSTCINLIGGIQEGKLNHITNKESYSDGFTQRFLPVTPKKNEPQQFSFESFNVDILKQANNFLESVYNYPETTLVISMEALKVYGAWYNENQVKYHGNAFAKSIQSKLEDTVWRFCLVIEVMNQVSTGNYKETVEAEVMELAIQKAEFHRATILKLFGGKHEKNALESQPKMFQDVYTNELNGRSYTSKELYEKFNGIWSSNSSLQERLNNTELFTRTPDGKEYLKAIQNVK